MQRFRKTAAEFQGMGVCIIVCMCMCVCCMFVCVCTCMYMCVPILEITNTGQLLKRRHVPSAAFIQHPLGHIMCCVHVFCAYCVLFIFKYSLLVI